MMFDKYHCTSYKWNLENKLRPCVAIIFFSDDVKLSNSFVINKFDLVRICLKSNIHSKH